MNVGGGGPRPWVPQALAAATCAGATSAGWVFQSTGRPAAAAAALVVAFLAGGWEAAVRSVQALARASVDVDLLMVLAAAGAAAVGHPLEGAVLLFLFATGNTLETFAFARTRRSIEGLMDLRPEEASVVVGEAEHRVPVADLDPGQVVRVRPGDRIPVDGRVLEGSSRIDESTLTGEPEPVAKTPGAEVFAGTLNGSGSLDIEVTRRADDTALARVIRLVETAREAQAPTQSWIEAVEGRYAAGVIAAAGVAVLIPWLLMGWTLDASFYRAMTLLVVASPCALVISIPATIVSAVSNGARRGVLFKGGAHLDALAGVRVMAVDKTGTLTRGRPEVVGVETTQGVDPDTLLRAAAAVEARSEHPLGDAVRAEADARGLPPSVVEGFASVAGHGVEGTVEGVAVAVGRRSWIEERVGAPVPDGLREWAAARAAEAATPVFVALDGRHAGALAVADAPRAHVATSLRQLKEAGIDTLVMLTGDDEHTARAVAMAVGIDEVHAGLFPEDKSRILAELRARHGPVAMVGDGVNDAPALAAADVGVAIGAAGSDVALETADVVVMGEELGGLAHAVRLSHRARAVVRQNLVFAVSVMVVLVVLALGGWIGLTAAVVGHEGSTLVVVLNGLRLLREGPVYA